MSDQVTTSTPPIKRGPGRPATGRTTTVIRVRLPNKEYAKLVQRAKAERWNSVDEYARVAILSFLNKKGQGTRAKEKREREAEHGRRN